MTEIVMESYKDNEIKEASLTCDRKITINLDLMFDTGCGITHTLPIVLEMADGCSMKITKGHLELSGEVKAHSAGKVKTKRDLKEMMKPHDLSKQDMFREELRNVLEILR